MKMLGGLGKRNAARPCCCIQLPWTSFSGVSHQGWPKREPVPQPHQDFRAAWDGSACCLKHEQETYEDAVRRMPKESPLWRPGENGHRSPANLLKETVRCGWRSSPGPKWFHNCGVSVVRNGKELPEAVPLPGRAGQAAGKITPVEAHRLSGSVDAALSGLGVAPAEPGKPAEGGERRSRGRGRRGRGGSRPSAEVRAAKSPPPREAGGLSPQAEARGAAASASARKKSAQGARRTIPASDGTAAASHR